MIAACVAIPLLLALAARWLPHPHPALAPACAGLTLAACLSLPWTGSALGAWLVPDPLGIHVAALACFAWLAACLLEPGIDPLAALVTGCLTLALLTDRPELTVLAAGVAVLAPVLGARLPGVLLAGPLLAGAVPGLALSVFGTALLQSLAPGGWSTLAEAAQQAPGAALGIAAVLILLGLGCCCLLIPAAAALRGVALPPDLAVLAGPLAGVWLVVALRLRGVLDGNVHAMAPGGMLTGAGLVLIAVGLFCVRRGAARLPAGATLAMAGAAAFGVGLGGEAGTAAGLLHLTLGCLALAASAGGGWAEVVGLAALAGLPPLGVFASAYGLFAASLASSAALAAVFAVLTLALAITAFHRLPLAHGRSAPIGWVGLALTLGAGWALPQAAVSWLLGIAAASR